VLGEKAMKCRAFAKALHYKEEEFHRGPTTQILESLIRFGNCINRLVFVQEMHSSDPARLLVEKPCSHCLIGTKVSYNLASFSLTISSLLNITFA